MGRSTRTSRMWSCPIKAETQSIPNSTRSARKRSPPTLGASATMRPLRRWNSRSFHLIPRPVSARRASSAVRSTHRVTAGRPMVHFRATIPTVPVTRVYVILRNHRRDHKARNFIRPGTSISALLPTTWAGGGIARQGAITETAKPGLGVGDGPVGRRRCLHLGQSGTCFEPGAVCRVHGGSRR